MAREFLAASLGIRTVAMPARGGFPAANRARPKEGCGGCGGGCGRRSGAEGVVAAGIGFTKVTGGPEARWLGGTGEIRLFTEKNAGEGALYWYGNACMRTFVLLLAACLCLPIALPAAVVSFGSDLLNESNSVSGANVAIQPHPLWAQLPPYHWISYANTGAGPGAVSPPNTNAQKGPNAVFYEYLPPNTRFVQMTVFADDTAAVYLIDQSNPSGTLLAPANWLQDGACARGAIGCESGEGLILEFAVNRYGPAILRFEVFQRGNGPFGLLYRGEAELAHSSEALSILMMVTGLGWFVWLEARKKRRQAQDSQRRNPPGLERAAA